MAVTLLVSYAGYPYTPSSLMPDNGLACLAGALADAGYEAHILDYGCVSTIRRLFPQHLGARVRPLAQKLFVEGRKLSLLERLRFLRAAAELDRAQQAETLVIAGEIAAYAERLGADYVGLKLWNGDGFSGSVAIAEALRQRLPKVRIIGGGPQVDYFGRHILDYTKAFDVLVQGEGELVLPELIGAWEAGRDWRGIPGLLWRDGAGIHANPSAAISDLNTLPMPVYDSNIYPALDGKEKIHIGVLDESRGCPNRCSFCIHPIKSGGKWSLKSPERVMDEMQTIMRGLNSRYFIYSGSNTSAKVALGIAEEILDRGLQVHYGCFGHIRGIAQADFAMLRQSGCEAIFYGLESACPRILKDAFHKSLDIGEAERVIKQTQDAGICAITSLIFPAPGEDAASRADTLNFLRRVRPSSAPVTIPGVIPGTPWEQSPQEYGFEKSQRPDLWEYALTYKIKLLFPPSMWKPLPYTLDGKSSRQMIKECGAFIADIEKIGVNTNLSHELILMANALGKGDNLNDFRNRCRAMFFGGDADGIAEMVDSLNKAVRPINKELAAAQPMAAEGAPA